MADPVPGPDSGSGPGEPLVEFWTVMRRLRAECPWKAEQTHRSLARYLLEETHEALEANATGVDPEQALRDAVRRLPSAPAPVE